jgi:hypothetical protein
MPGRAGAELRVYDDVGRLTGIISSEWGTQNLLSARATVTTSGPGTLEFSLAERPAWSMTHGTRVDLHLWGSAEPVWGGYITSAPSALSTRRPYRYDAVGWRSQLAGVIIPQQTWSGWRISQVVRDLVRRYVEPRTSIVMDPILIDERATYILGDYRAERATLTSVLDDLRDLAGLYVWGVGSGSSLSPARWAGTGGSASTAPSARPRRTPAPWPTESGSRWASACPTPRTSG